MTVDVEEVLTDLVECRREGRFLGDVDDHPVGEADVIRTVTHPPLRRGGITAVGWWQAVAAVRR
jgi:hypothetical protein